jgi:subtilisin family serine protease
LFKLLLAILFFIPMQLNAQLPIRVLEVDTGASISVPLIRNHVNMANWEKDDYIDVDPSGHGTHIAGIILDHVCDQIELVSCKFYDPFDDTKDANMKRGVECFKRALKEHVTIINYSAGGTESNNEEYEVLKQVTEAGIKIIVAAGNNGKDLNSFHYYPAKYSLQNLIVVGNLEKNGRKNLTSNYGLKGMVWEVGTKVWSTLPDNTGGFMTGSSQATAVHTNRLLREMCKDLK